MLLKTFLLSTECDGLGARPIREEEMFPGRLCNAHEGQIVTENSPQKVLKNILRSIAK